MFAGTSSLVGYLLAIVTARLYAVTKECFGSRLKTWAASTHLLWFRAVQTAKREAVKEMPRNSETGLAIAYFDEPIVSWHSLL